jgi:putative redox protein
MPDANPPGGLEATHAAASAHRPAEPTPVRIDWLGDLQFEAGRPDGPKVRIDANAQSAPSPVDMLLAAIGTCAATDVVEIMKKQRTPLEALTIRVEATRVPTIPRRLASAILHFSLRGAGITIEKATRAVELSVTKYCSVRSSLIEDAPVTWTIDLQS